MKVYFKDPKLNVRFKPSQEKESEPINGPVITYFIPLEEVHAKYGPPGDLNGYEPTPQYGARIR